MISGHDIVIPCQSESGFVFDRILHLARHVWKEAVIEDAETGDLLNPEYEDAFVGVNGVMIYKDEASRKSWNENGSVEENRNTMIHVIAGWDKITLVVDDEKDSATEIIVAATRSAFFCRCGRAEYFRG
jgi:hypothetical protein